MYSPPGFLLFVREQTLMAQPFDAATLKTHAVGGEPAATACVAADDPDSGRPRNRGWADLMQRSFGFDVLACPRCPGRLTLVALIQEPTVILRILRHLGLPNTVPVMRPARDPRELTSSALTPRRRRA